MYQILKDITVLDLSRLLPAPLATQFLAQWGATVIKIEDPNQPDSMRFSLPYNPKTQQSAYYTAVNNGKKSLTLNLRTAEGKAIFFELVQKADIVFESYRAGVMQKIGIDYETVTKINPKIIYVSVTGYGQTGAYSHLAGHDLNYIAYSGILGLNGIKNGEPIIPTLQIADIAGGSYMAASACLLALYNRLKTGKGSHIDVPMLEGALPLISLAYAEQQANAENPPQRGAGLLSGDLPNYNVYACKDGKFIALAALEAKFWIPFCNAVQKPEWINAIFDNTANTKQQVENFFLAHTQAECIALFQHKDVCISPIYSIEDLENDTHLQYRNAFVQYTHPQYGSIKAINQPLRFANLPAHTATLPASPLLGEHTAEVLQNIGYTAQQIEDFKKQNIV